MTEFNSKLMMVNTTSIHLIREREKDRNEVTICFKRQLEHSHPAS